MAADSKSQPSFSPGRRWKIGLDVIVRTALVLAVVVMVNYLGAHFFGRFYLSSQTRVELSSQTLNLLKSLTNHIASAQSCRQSLKTFAGLIPWPPNICGLVFVVLSNVLNANSRLCGRTC